MGLSLVLILRTRWGGDYATLVLLHLRHEVTLVLPRGVARWGTTSEA